MQGEYQISVISGTQGLLLQVFLFPVYYFQKISILIVAGSFVSSTSYWADFWWDRNSSPDCAVSSTELLQRLKADVHAKAKLKRLFYTRASDSSQSLGKYIEMWRPVPNRLSPHIFSPVGYLCIWSRTSWITWEFPSSGISSCPATDRSRFPICVCSSTKMHWSMNFSFPWKVYSPDTSRGFPPRNNTCNSLNW